MPIAEVPGIVIFVSLREKKLYIFSAILGVFAYGDFFLRKTEAYRQWKISKVMRHGILVYLYNQLLLQHGEGKILDCLLNDAICTDFALKGMIGKAELLIFSSLNCQRSFTDSRGNFTFGGSSGDNKLLLHMINRIIMGRRLDDAWEHARPLDELRQKAECRYCGFVSTHGGISRLKAHLGGGNPRIRLPACQKIEAAAPIDQRGRPHDVAWEHAKPLNKTECKYFSFGSLREEISHHKIHSGGGDQESHMSLGQKCHLKQKKSCLREKKFDGRYVTRNKRNHVWMGKKFSRIQAAGAHAETRGRPLDNAWEHAKPLDEARQKTQCNHCGFVSLYGGISRLKAHLGGGCPQLQLQGCPRVSLEVKSVMEQWFNEWVKNSSAAWTRKSHAGPARHSKRGRPLDDTWEHAIPLDEIRQATKCKYCGFLSKRGGILRVKAHLAGGDPTTHLEGCPNVPPEVKSWMAEGIKKCRKGSKGEHLETVERVLQEAERTASESQWSVKRHHILQETIDEIMNKSLKKSLQKIIDEKNARLQKMQSEIQSLESRKAIHAFLTEEFLLCHECLFPLPKGLPFLGTICLQCGDRGFDNAFVFCVKCLDVAVHRYCLDVIPETFDEFVRWVCEDCEAAAQEQSALHGHYAIQSQTTGGSSSPTQLGDMNVEHAILSAADERKKCQPSSSHQLEEEKVKDTEMQNAKLRDDVSPEKNVKKKRRIMESNVQKDQHGLNASSEQSNGKCANIDIAECSRLASDSALPNKLKENEGSEQKDQRFISIKPHDLDTDPSMAEHPSISCSGSSKSSQKNRTGKSSGVILQGQTIHRTGPLSENKGLNLESQCANLNTEERNFSPSDEHVGNRESEDGEEKSSAPQNMNDFCKDYPKDLVSSSAEPVVHPIWRGIFNIWNKKHDILDGLIAHMSSKACEKVYETACQFQPVIHLEMLPRTDVWPKSFQTSEPSGDNIALYFFPSVLSKRIYQNLVKEMMHKELALKAVMPNSELLIFTSTELPLLYWTFQGKHYLWGVFRGRQSPQSDSHAYKPESGDKPAISLDLTNDTGFSGGKNPVRSKRSSRSPRSPLSNSASYVSGTY
ncbi:hypothetical protein Sango_2161200 [Sesamum angolense]|uniref:BED-type domain-containing protein n=1 Tax=Sesamum angolense TaxID=2727404 RepID=A0AAE2BMN3_9LAMI|nr:hypothetical protein Sango_2161200 [Sesamum angolense]